MPFWPPLNLCPTRRPSSWGLAPSTCAAGSTWKLREWGGTPVKDDASSDDLGSHKWKPWVSLKSSPIKQEGFLVVALMPCLSLACLGTVILPATPASQGHRTNIITSKYIGMEVLYFGYIPKEISNQLHYLNCFQWKVKLFFNMGSHHMLPTKQVFLSESEWGKLSFLFVKINFKILHLPPITEINDDQHRNITSFN